MTLPESNQDSKAGERGGLMRVCFVLLRAYAVFRPEINERFGGAEVRLYHIARALARREGVEVHVLSRDFGQPAHEIIDGVHLHRFYQGGAGLRKIPGMKNLLSPFGLYAALKRIRPDVLVQFCAGMETGIVGHYSARHGVPSVFMVSSDPDVDGRFESQSPFWLRRSYLYGLERMDAVICQNTYQREQLEARFGRSGPVIPNPVDVAETCEPPRGKRVLWVGRAIALKRPGWFLDLAESLPEVDFQMVLAEGHDRPFFEKTVERASSIANLRLATSVPFQEVDAYFREAGLFVSTSEHEGLPNTFLQAMRLGVPVVSTGVDPNGMLSQGGAGCCVEHDIAALREAVVGLLEDAERRSRAGRAAWEYVRSHHEIGAIVERYAAVFESVWKERGGWKGAGAE
ncbi:MAG: glycosyltransferase family 4 protein [Candidatus Sumerlaeota bacterium]